MRGWSGVSFCLRALRAGGGFMGVGAEREIENRRQNKNETKEKC